MEKIGATQLVALAVAIGATATAVDAVLADGQVTLTDFSELPGLLNGLRLFAAVEFKDVLPQASDLDDSEKALVAAAFRDNLNVHSESLEGSIELGFGVLLEGIQALQIIKAIGAKIKPTA